MILFSLIVLGLLCRCYRSCHQQRGREGSSVGSSCDEEMVGLGVIDAWGQTVAVEQHRKPRLEKGSKRRSQKKKRCGSHTRLSTEPEEEYSTRLEKRGALDPSRVLQTLQRETRGALSNS